MPNRRQNSTFQLRFQISQLQLYCDRYSYQLDEAPLRGNSKLIVERGFFAKHELLDVCYWKTPRSQSKCRKNDEEFIREVTAISLSTQNEKLKIEVLTLLSGVSWPTASTLLHFCYPEKYPILDFRALWSLGIDQLPGKYDFDFWWSYVSACRKISLENTITIRQLDKALWQYSKEHQI